MRFYLLLACLLLPACGLGEDDLALVGGRRITKAEFEAYLTHKRLDQVDEKRRQQLLDQYLERETLAAAIEKSDKLDEALIQAELNEFRKEMLISRYFDKVLKDTVTDEAVRGYYGAHAADYEERKVHVAHILVRANRTMGEAERQAKLTKAQEAYSKVRAGGDFAGIAAAYSEDKVSAPKGGDLGWLKQGAIDKGFSERVFAMKVGEVSEPFETSFGFHVVELLEGPTTVKRPFEAVQGDIRYQLRNEVKEAEVKRLMAAVTAKKAS